MAIFDLLSGPTLPIYNFAGVFFLTSIHLALISLSVASSNLSHQGPEGGGRGKKCLIFLLIDGD